MAGTVLQEFVYYCDPARWRSRFGTLTSREDELVFEGFPEIRIPVHGLRKIAVQTSAQLMRAGIGFPELQFKPKTQLFLLLECDRPSEEILGQIRRETLIFGSGYHDEKRANRQIESVKRQIYRVRYDVTAGMRLGIDDTIEEFNRLTGKSSQKERSSGGWLHRLFGSKPS